MFQLIRNDRFIMLKQCKTVACKYQHIGPIRLSSECWYKKNRHYIIKRNLVELNLFGIFVQHRSCCVTSSTNVSFLAGLNLSFKGDLYSAWYHDTSGVDTSKASCDEERRIGDPQRLWICSKVRQKGRYSSCDKLFPCCHKKNNKGFTTHVHTLILRWS